MAMIVGGNNRRFRFIIGDAFESFVDGLLAFPFLRIALFAVIAGKVFDLLGYSTISEWFYALAILAFANRLFSLIPFVAQKLFGAVSHPVTKFAIISFFVGAECAILQPQLEYLLGTTGVVGTVCSVMSLIARVTFFMAAMAFLVRVFIALFFGK